MSPLARNAAAPLWRPLTVLELHSLGVVMDLALEAAMQAHRDNLQGGETGAWLILVRAAHGAAQLIIQDDMLRRPEAWKEQVESVERETLEQQELAAELEADGRALSCNQNSAQLLEGEHGCTYCTGEACALCGAGLWRKPWLDGVMCEHDVVERHTLPEPNNSQADGGA